ncbi:MAG: hypothetical protein OEZ09_00045 [Betaproteobacteria bacterium]|nr:hypothetical protein [Betaproteobacteria bacterium]MDH4322608.1 hypothetical protein [Betaproteobacteria bacterium]MDH5576825.1 hypothetical protein [Betaproteobacteria bacterium]
MTDQAAEKTPLERSRDIIKQFKEMVHYSEGNIEKLTEIWLLLDGELKKKKIAKNLEDLLAHQNKFHDALAALAKDFEKECDALDKKPAS